MGAPARHWGFSIFHEWANNDCGGLSAAEQQSPERPRQSVEYLSRDVDLMMALASPAGRWDRSLFAAKQAQGAQWPLMATRGTPHDLAVQQMMGAAGGGIGGWLRHFRRSPHTFKLR